MVKHLRRCLIFLSTKAAYQEADHCVGEHPHISSSSELSLGCTCERSERVEERGVPESWIHVCRTNKAGRSFRFHRPFGLYFRWQSDRWQSRLVLPSWRNSSSTCAKGKESVSRVEEQSTGNRALVLRQCDLEISDVKLRLAPLPSACSPDLCQCAALRSPFQYRAVLIPPLPLFKGHQSLYLSLLWACSDIVLQCLRLQCCWAL